MCRNFWTKRYVAENALPALMYFNFLWSIGAGLGTGLVFIGAGLQWGDWEEQHYLCFTSTVPICIILLQSQSGSPSNPAMHTIFHGEKSLSDAKGSFSPWKYYSWRESICWRLSSRLGGIPVKYSLEKDSS